MNTLYATFNDQTLAEKAIGALMDYGMRPEDISLFHSHRTKTELDDAIAEPMDSMKPYMPPADGPILAGIITANPANAQMVQEVDYRATADDSTSPEDEEMTAKQGITTTTAADAGAGAIKGAGIGLGVGAVAALASLTIPGVGIVIGAGALATALAGVAATAGAGAVAGAVTGYLKDQGIDSRVASNYARTIETGGAILAVQVPSADVDEFLARSVLKKYGCANIDAHANSANGGYVA